MERYISFNTKKIVKWVFWSLLIFEFFIVFGDIFFNEFEWLSSSSLRRFFNITREDSLGNWFSSVQTLLVALVLFAIAAIRQSKDKVGWMILGFFFAFMSLDDGSMLHERIGTAFEDWVEAGGGEWINSYGWQIAIGPVLVAFAIYAVWFLWKRINKKELMILIFAFAILAFAIVLDYVEGMELIDNHTIVHFEKVIEEFLEMFANTLLLVTFLKFFFRQKKKLQIEFHQ